MRSRIREGFNVIMLLLFAACILALLSGHVLRVGLTIFTDIDIHGRKALIVFACLALMYFALLIGGRIFQRLLCAIVILLIVCTFILFALKFYLTIAGAFQTSLSQGILVVSVLLVGLAGMLLWDRYRKP